MYDGSQGAGGGGGQYLAVSCSASLLRQSVVFCPWGLAGRVGLSFSSSFRVLTDRQPRLGALLMAPVHYLVMFVTKFNYSYLFFTAFVRDCAAPCSGLWFSTSSKNAKEKIKCGKNSIKNTFCIKRSRGLARPRLIFGRGVIFVLPNVFPLDHRSTPRQAYIRADPPE